MKYRALRIRYVDNGEEYNVDVSPGFDARSVLELWLSKATAPKDGNYEIERQSFQVKDRKIVDD